MGSVWVRCWLVVVCSKNGAARSCCGAGVYSCLLLYSRWLVGCGGLWCWLVVDWIVYVVGGDREQTFSALLLCSRRVIPCEIIGKCSDSSIVQEALCTNTKDD